MATRRTDSFICTAHDDGCSRYIDFFLRPTPFFFFFYFWFLCSIFCCLLSRVSSSVYSTPFALPTSKKNWLLCLTTQASAQTFELGRPLVDRGGLMSNARDQQSYIYYSTQRRKVYILYYIFFIISYSFLREGFVQGSDWSRSLGVAFWSANEM